MTTEDIINGLPLSAETKAALLATHRIGVERGISRRCPTCNAGIGKWCIGPNGVASPTVAHSARKADR